MPVSRDVKNILASAAKAAHQNKTIEPLHLLAAIVEDRDSRLAQLLRDHGITRQKISHALDSTP
jgi:ATP-dependent Clp protease ATP-binding subunit ClpA